MLRLGLGALGAAALVGLTGVGFAAMLDRASVVEVTDTQIVPAPEAQRV